MFYHCICTSCQDSEIIDKQLCPGHPLVEVLEDPGQEVWLFELALIPGTMEGLIVHVPVGKPAHGKLTSHILI